MKMRERIDDCTLAITHARALCSKKSNAFISLFSLFPLHIHWPQCESARLCACSCSCGFDKRWFQKLLIHAFISLSIPLDCPLARDARSLTSFVNFPHSISMWTSLILFLFHKSQVYKNVKLDIMKQIKQIKQRTETRSHTCSFACCISIESPYSQEDTQQIAVLLGK